MSPRTANPEVRDRLISVGVAAFSRYGYHGVGLKQLLDEARVPKGSFYNYFGSKEDYAAAAIETYARCLTETFESHMKKKRSPLAGLKSFFSHLDRNFKDSGYRDACPVGMLGTELELESSCLPALQQAMQGFRELLIQALASAQEKGEIRQDMDARVMGSLLTDAWEGAVIRMRIEQSSRPLKQVVAHLLDGLFREQHP